MGSAVGLNGSGVVGVIISVLGFFKENLGVLLGGGGFRGFWVLVLVNIGSQIFLLTSEF